MSAKRENVLDWDDYFMGIAVLSGQRSKDPVTQVGACIVNENKRIVGVGYNGFPRDCSDDEYPWGKESENNLEKKNFYGNIYLYKKTFKYLIRFVSLIVVVHAEANAILNSFSANLQKCTIYQSLYPCNNCAQLIIQAGIQNVVYLSDKNAKKETSLASKRMLNSAGISIR